MTIATLGGLPGFLRVLTTYPSPDAAMAALVDGPMSRYHAGAARFWMFDGADLLHAGGHGWAPEETARYAILDPAVPFVLWEAVRARRIVTTDSHAPRQTDLDVVDEAFRRSLVESRSLAAIVRAPLVLDDAVVGAIGIALTRPWPDNAEARALVTAVTSALALWATTPSAGVAAAVAATRARARSVELVLSDRERDILRLAEARVPTSAIARTLQVSESTVKSELQDAMRALGTSDRVEAAARARALGLLT